ncbi:hypothetical protein [Lentimicrobium sp.]|uniref:hypothetical protein n=1 Tax=Lentimicrobium sp. TaxID=2034841 RepID=UPI002CC114E6|nr:hypothetical protein [Lentimicrobium sp.]MCO5262175.1 hypothetical protein [Lentimicrobium sp.]HPF63369.1 hypothetical protein [Lentimicrobium sp.]HPR27145.1 hypothetical protein [Lentimicrobium sp.]HRW69669.1 hypothetical protein [Lentimicrobium sp.]
MKRADRVASSDHQYNGLPKRQSYEIKGINTHQGIAPWQKRVIFKYTERIDPGFIYLHLGAYSRNSRSIFLAEEGENPLPSICRLARDSINMSAPVALELTSTLIMFKMGIDTDLTPEKGPFFFLRVTNDSSISIDSGCRRLPPFITLDLNLTK